MMDVKKDMCGISWLLKKAFLQHVRISAFPVWLRWVDDKVADWPTYVFYDLLSAQLRLRWNDHDPVIQFGEKHCRPVNMPGTSLRSHGITHIGEPVSEMV